MLESESNPHSSFQSFVKKVVWITLPQPLAGNGKTGLTAFSPVVGWRAGLARDRCSCGRSCAGCSVSQRGACTPLVSQGLPSGSSPAPAPESLQEHRAHLNTVRCQSPRRRVCLRESSCEGKRQHTFLRVLTSPHFLAAACPHKSLVLRGECEW